VARIDEPKSVDRGFLPIETNAFDRVFIAVMIFVAVNLLWMRFLEAALPLYWATLVSLVVGGLIVARG
jgi:predicted small integral membrane protein